VGKELNKEMLVSRPGMKHLPSKISYSFVQGDVMTSFGLMLMVHMRSTYINYTATQINHARQKIGGLNTCFNK